LSSREFFYNVRFLLATVSVENVVRHEISVSFCFFFVSFFVRTQHKINVKAPEDHQSLEVGIDSVVAAERFVAQINDAESKKVYYFRHNDHEKAILKSCRPQIRNRGHRKSLFITAKIFKSKKFLVVTAVVKMKIPTIYTKQN